MACIAAKILCASTTSFFLLSNALASPGAHGPNGEHLDTRIKVATSANPKFESFTETFELVGELTENQLSIYLHDFKTNAPIADASLELEVGDLAATAEYSEQLQAYLLTNQGMLEELSQIGLHEIVITILTDQSGDLLVANLENLKSSTSNHDGVDLEHDHHHDDFPLWTVIICVGVFIGGILIGRISKVNKS